MRPRSSAGRCSPRATTSGSSPRSSASGRRVSPVRPTRISSIRSRSSIPTCGVRASRWPTAASGCGTPTWGPGGPLLASQQFSPLFPTHLLAFLLPFWEIAGLDRRAQDPDRRARHRTSSCRRAFALDPGPAALGAIAFAFSAYMIIWLEHPLTNAWILLPWAFLLTDRLLRAGDPRPSVLALGALFGVLLLAGHPEAELTVLVAAAAYLAFRLVEERWTGRLGRWAVIGRAGWWTLAVVAGAPAERRDDHSRAGAFRSRRAGSAGRSPAALRHPGELDLPRMVGQTRPGPVPRRTVQRLRREDGLLRRAPHPARPRRACRRGRAASSSSSSAWPASRSRSSSRRRSTTLVRALPGGISWR